MGSVEAAVWTGSSFRARCQPAVSADIICSNCSLLANCLSALLTPNSPKQLQDREQQLHVNDIRINT